MSLCELPKNFSGDFSNRVGGIAPTPPKDDRLFVFTVKESLFSLGFMIKTFASRHQLGVGSGKNAIMSTSETDYRQPTSVGCRLGGENAIMWTSETAIASRHQLGVGWGKNAIIENNKLLVCLFSSLLVFQHIIFMVFGRIKQTQNKRSSFGGVRAIPPTRFEKSPEKFFGEHANRFFKGEISIF